MRRRTPKADPQAQQTATRLAQVQEQVTQVAPPQDLLRRAAESHGAARDRGAASRCPLPGRQRRHHLLEEREEGFNVGSLGLRAPQPGDRLVEEGDRRLCVAVPDLLQRPVVAVGVAVGPATAPEPPAGCCACASTATVDGPSKASAEKVTDEPALSKMPSRSRSQRSANGV